MFRIIIIILMTLTLLIQCESPEVSRQEEYMKVYIPMVQQKNSTLQTSPLILNSVNFVPLNELDFSKDTTLFVGVYCGGMVLPDENIFVEFELETDSLTSLQKKNSVQSSFSLLPEQYYSIDSWKVEIPRNNVNGYLKVNLKNTLIPEGSKYILPLRIKQVSKYEIDPSTSFILLGIEK